MAIDTENKRRSTVYVLPVPDSSIDPADKQQVAYIYSGLTVPVVSATPEDRIFNVPAEDRVFVVPAEDRIFNVPAEDRVFEVG